MTDFEVTDVITPNTIADPIEGHPDGTVTNPNPEPTGGPIIAPIGGKPTVEPDKPDPANNTDGDTDLSARFAALSRQEKAILEQRQALKEQKDEMTTQADVEAKLRESVKSGNPLAILEHYGLTTDDIINAMIGDEGTYNGEIDERSEVEKLRQELKDKEENQRLAGEKAEEEAQKAKQNSIDENIAYHKQQIEAHIRQNPEQYKLTNIQGAFDLAWDVTEGHYNETGTLLTLEQASNHVEQYLKDQLIKMQEAMGLKPKEENVQTDSGQNESQTTTLTESVAERPRFENVSNVSQDESKERAAKKLVWNK